LSEKWPLERRTGKMKDKIEKENQKILERLKKFYEALLKK